MNTITTPLTKRIASLVLSVLCLALPTASVHAISAADANAILKGTTNYIEDDQDIAPGGGCADTTAVPLVGGDNAAKMFNFLMSKGLKDFQAVGIMANIQAESGFDPAVNQGGGHANATPVDGQGFGLAQWTFDARQKPLVKFANSLTPPEPVNTLGPQLGFLWSELAGGYKTSVLTPLLATTSYEAAVELVMKKFESPQDQSASAVNGRIAGGRPLLKKFAGTGTAGATATGCAAGGTLSASKIVQIALAEVGVNEGTTDNAAGSCKFQGPGSCPPGEAWCADFISWVYNKAGVPFTGGADGGWRIAGAAALSEWFKANGTWFKNPGTAMPKDAPNAPQPGDVVFYPPGSADAGGSGHVNIVVSYDGKTVITVGGNQSDAVTTGPRDVFGTAGGWGRLK